MPIKIFIYICLQLSILVYGKDTRVIGGIDANIADFPYIASLRRISDNKHICGGSIISDQHILTAANCFQWGYLNESSTSIYVGSGYLSRNLGSSYLADKVIVHPGYPGVLGVQSCDIAVVKVQGTIPFNQFQNKIGLPTKDINNADIGMFSGWGLTFSRSNKPSEKLKSIWMIVYEKYRCTNFQSMAIYADQFCALRKIGMGLCIGDSGGPLVRVDGIIGIATVVQMPCAVGVPDVFTKVYLHLDFIRNAMES